MVGATTATTTTTTTTTTTNIKTAILSSLVLSMIQVNQFHILSLFLFLTRHHGRHPPPI